MFPLVMARISTSTDKVFAKKTPQAKLYHKCLSCWGQLEEVGQREGGTHDSPGRAVCAWGQDREVGKRDAGMLNQLHRAKNPVGGLRAESVHTGDRQGKDHSWMFGFFP